MVARLGAFHQRYSITETIYLTGKIPYSSAIILTALHLISHVCSHDCGPPVAAAFLFTGFAMDIMIPQSPGASYSEFLQKAMEHPRLSAQEQAHLHADWSELGDQQAFDRLYMANVRLVHHMVGLYMSFGDRRFEAFQNGLLGLAKGIRKYNPDSGVPLGSYVNQWIQAEIRNGLIKSEQDLIQIATTQERRKLFFSLRRFLRDDRKLTPAEHEAIAEELGVKAGAVKDMEERMRTSMASIMPHDPSDDAPNFDHEVRPVADDRPGPEELLEEADEQAQRQALAETLLSLLNDRERYIVSRRHLIEGDEKPATRADLAKEMGITGERVRQIETKAMQKMKQHTKE